MDQYIGDAYRDPVVECGRSVLDRLSAAVESDIAADGIFSVTRILKVPDADGEYWETTTVHAAEVMGDIHGNLLNQADPPAYLLDAIGNLVVAHVYHENQRRSRTIPLFSPDKTELAAHVLTLWTMIPDQVRTASYEEEYTLPLHQINETTLELFKPQASDVWSLSFKHQVNCIRMLAPNSAARVWVDEAA